MIYCAVVNGIRQVVNGTLRALLKAARGIITIAEKVYHGISGICGQIPLLGWLCYLFAGLLKLLIELAKGIHWLLEQLVIGIEAALEYIYWAIGWIVWAIYWGFRVIDLGFCMANPYSVRYIHLCVKNTGRQARQRGRLESRCLHSPAGSRQPVREMWDHFKLHREHRDRR